LSFFSSWPGTKDIEKKLKRAWKRALVKSFSDLIKIFFWIMISIRVSNSHCEFALLRKKAKAKRIRFASHRFLAQGVRFASLSLFKRSNSQKSENFRLILAIIFQKKAFLSGWNLSFFRYFRENYGKTTKIENGGYYQFEICSDRLIFLPMVQIFSKTR